MRHASVATSNAAYRAVVALDGNSSAIASRCDVHAGTTRAHTNSDACSRHVDADARLRPPPRRAAIIEVVILADGRGPGDVSATVPAGAAAHRCWHCSR